MINKHKNLLEFTNKLIEDKEKSIRNQLGAILVDEKFSIDTIRIKDINSVSYVGALNINIFEKLTEKYQKHLESTLNQVYLGMTTNGKYNVPKTITVAFLKYIEIQILINNSKSYNESDINKFKYSQKKILEALYTFLPKVSE